MTNDIYVRVTKLPPRIRGMCAKGIDNYNIYLSDALNREQMLKTYEHELDHIRNGDFEKTDVQQIEYEAHRR